MMLPFSLPIRFGGFCSGRAGRLVFVLFVFGIVLFCAGILLSIFAFQTCQADGFSECSMTLKVLGPSLAAVGLGSILIAKSKARLYLRQRQMQGDQVDTDSFFLCGESNQFVQFLIFGFLFLTSGVLISVLGMWVPGCGTVLPHQQGNTTAPVNPAPRGCGFLSLQIMGPLIVLVGLCFFVVAYLKKKHVLSPEEEASFDDDPQQLPPPEPFQITVGDSVMTFPPPPPPYFADQSFPEGRNQNAENPPSYSSIFNGGSQVNSPGRRENGSPETTYTISTSIPSEIIPSPYFSTDPPPKYEEKEEPSNLPTSPSFPASSTDESSSSPKL